MTVTLDITADVERMDVPPMHVTMYFKRPDKTHFESEGFAMLPREGLFLGTERLRARYLVQRVAQQVEGGRAITRVDLVGRTPKIVPPGMALFVDPSRWTAERILAEFADGRRITTVFENQETEGVWLPSRATVTITPAPGDTAEAATSEQQQMAIRRQPLRNGTITIRLSGYRLNTGLSDDIFRSDEGGVK
jgi:outer membrane lipoprotein-sorting protein